MPNLDASTAKDRGLAHQVGLDGLRGLAVAGVVGYHLGIGWLSGGFLGVSLFFTLSGFLITNLLLAELDGTGRIALGRFWGRRARRLLPAALMGIALAVLLSALGGQSEQLRQLPGDVIGAVAYVANWRFVLNHSAYTSQYLAASPLLHFWSLAIEEQLYLFLPLLVALIARRRRSQLRLGVVVGLLLVASAAATLVFGPGRGGDPNRVYFGTDTRMFELLVGALLAVVVRFPVGQRRLSGFGRRAADGVGLAALVVALAFWATAHETDRWLFAGGLWLVALLSAIVIYGSFAGGRLDWLLRARPLALLGRLSYGIYVYHWPIFLYLDASRTALRGLALIGVRLGVTATVAGASYRWLEMPIRRRRFSFPRPALALVPAVPAITVCLAVILGGQASARAVVAESRHPIVIRSAVAGGAVPAGARTDGVPDGVPGGGERPPKTGRPGPPLARVLFIGDSLVQQAYPTFAARLNGRGVQTAVLGGPGQSLMAHKAAWLATLQAGIVADAPDLVVLESCCGPFDSDLPWAGPDGGPVARDTPAMYAEWHRLAAQVTTIASSRGARVLWVLGPPLHTNGFYGPVDGQVSKVNEVYAGLASCGVGFVDWRVIANPDGSFAATLLNDAGHPVQIRHADGFHFTPAGIDVLAGITVGAIDREWATPSTSQPGVCI